MKKTFYTVLFVCLAALPLTAQIPHLIFHAELNGSELNPAVNTDGRGLVTLLYTTDRSKVTVTGMYVNLEGTITEATIRQGKTGENGPVLLDLMPILFGKRLEGQLDAPPALLQNLLPDGVYAEIRTTAHPNGEIRGQFVCETDLDYEVAFNGDQVVPASGANAVAFGAIHFPLGSRDVVYAFTVRGLSGPVTSIGIYEGQPGEDGPLVVSIPNPFGIGFIQGLILLDTVDEPDFLRKAREGRYYILVKTANFPNGEIRGQIKHYGYFESLAPINGLQQVPPPGPTPGFGFSRTQLSPTLDSLHTLVFINTIQPTSVKVHIGNPGEIGPELVQLDPMPVPGYFGKSYPITESQLTDFAQNRLYINVTTNNFPNGEIRGVMKNTLRKGYFFDLCGLQVVPPNNSHALGVAVASVDQANCYLNYKIIFDGLSGTPTDGYVADGDFGMNGLPMHAFVNTEPIIPGSHEIMTAFGPVIEDGGAYFQISTQEYPDGEIRGQVRRTLTCPDNVGVQSPPMISAVQVSPVPFGDVLNVSFNSAEEFDGRVVLYDLLGAVAMVQTHKGLAGEQTLVLDTALLPAGNYTVVLEIPGRDAGILLKKVVKP